MSINSHYYCPSDDALRVYLPVRFYELTLKHRLLQQLGGFSHLLLDALTLLPERGVGWVLEVTGLNPQQLQPILNRMHGLGLLEKGRLSQRGEKLSAWKRLVHGKVRNVWLDGNYKGHYSFCGDASMDVVELPDENAPFVIHRWRRDNAKTSKWWPCLDWNEDCERQKKRILKYPEQYLPTVFETFHDSFIETGFNPLEWELDVHYVPDKSKLVALEVELAPTDLRSGSAFDYLIAYPVLCLDTSYQLPEGAPIELRNVQPEDQRRTVSFGHADLGMDQLHDIPPSSWTWPDVDEQARLDGIDFLFQQITVPDTQAEVVFNRKHRLVDRWQCVGFGQSAIENSLQEVKGIHRIGGDA